MILYLYYTYAFIKTIWKWTDISNLLVEHISFMWAQTFETLFPSTNSHLENGQKGEAGLRENNAFGKIQTWRPNRGSEGGELDSKDTNQL